jgi:hypothetical protein
MAMRPATTHTPISARVSIGPIRSSSRDRIASIGAVTIWLPGTTDQAFAIASPIRGIRPVPATNDVMIAAVGAISPNCLQTESTEIRRRRRLDRRTCWVSSPKYEASPGRDPSRRRRSGMMNSSSFSQYAPWSSRNDRKFHTGMLVNRPAAGRSSGSGGWSGPLGAGSREAQ